MDKASWQKLERAYGARIREVYPESLINNGGVEAWALGLPVDWLIYPGTATGVIVTQNSGGGAARYSSGTVADVAVTTGGAGQQGGLKTVLGDPQWKEVQTEYASFSAWVKVTNVADQGKVHLMLQDHDSGGNDVAYSPPWSDGRWLEDASGDWKLMSVTKEIRDSLTDGGEGQVFGAVIARSTGAETINFSVDDAVFVRGVYPQGINKVSDPLYKTINTVSTATAIQRAVANVTMFGESSDNLIRIMPGTVCVDGTGSVIFNATNVVTINPSVIGVNGRQDCPSSPTGWYWIYLLADGSLLPGQETSTLYGYLKKANGDAFLPPGTYTYRRRVGCVYVKRIDGGTTYVIRPFYQVGTKVMYSGDPDWSSSTVPSLIDEATFGNWSTFPEGPPDTMCACVALTPPPGTPYPYLAWSDFAFSLGASRSKLVPVNLNPVIPPFWRIVVGLNSDFFHTVGRFRSMLSARSSLVLWSNIFRSAWTIVPQGSFGRAFLNHAIREELDNTYNRETIRTYTFEAPITAGNDTILSDRRITIGLQKTGDLNSDITVPYPLVVFCDGYDDPLTHIERITGLN